jgi:hypothetical protein
MSTKEIFVSPNQFPLVFHQSVRNCEPANLIHVVRINPGPKEPEFALFEESPEDRLEYLDSEIRILMKELAELHLPYERDSRVEVAELLKYCADERREILNQLHPRQQKSPHGEPTRDYSDWLKWARSKKTAIVLRVAPGEPIKPKAADRRRVTKKLKKPTFFLRMAFWRISFAFRIFRKR